MPNNRVILTDYEARNKHKNKSDNDSGELEPPMIREFAIHILQTIHFLQQMDPLNEEDILEKQVELKLTKKHLGINKVLIFDLDETLAHCVRQENPNQPPDVRLDIHTQTGKVLNAGFNVRPYTHEMLKEVNKFYEVVVFTASHKWYADVILDHIDPNNEYF